MEVLLPFLHSPMHGRPISPNYNLRGMDVSYKGWLVIVMDSCAAVGSRCDVVGRYSYYLRTLPLALPVPVKPKIHTPNLNIHTHTHTHTLF